MLVTLGQDLEIAACSELKRTTAKKSLKIPIILIEILHIMYMYKYIYIIAVSGLIGISVGPTQIIPQCNDTSYANILLSK